MQGLALKLKGPVVVKVDGETYRTYKPADEALDAFEGVSDLAYVYGRHKRAGTVVQVIDKGKKLVWTLEVKRHASGLALYWKKTGHLAGIYAS